MKLYTYIHCTHAVSTHWTNKNLFLFLFVWVYTVSYAGMAILTIGWCLVGYHSKLLIFDLSGLNVSNQHRCSVGGGVLHPLCPASDLSCIHPILHPSCPASSCPCIHPVLHPPVPASILSCIWSVLQTSCPASVLFCIGSVRHMTCPASDLSCIRPVLYPACSADLRTNVFFTDITLLSLFN